MPSVIEQIAKDRQVKGKILTPLIDAWLMKRSDDLHLVHPKLLEHLHGTTKAWSTKGRFAASASGGCSRKAVLRFTGTPSPESKRETPRSERILDDGHYRHLRLHSYLLYMSDDPKVSLKSLGFEQTVEVKSLRVRGSLDHRIAIRIGGSWIEYIVDFKGASQWSSSQLSYSGAHGGHISQGITYAWATGVRNLIILYEDKNTQEFHEFVITVTQEMIEKEISKVKILNKHVKKGTLPQRPVDCKKGRFRGYLCEFRRLCYPELAEEDEDDETATPKVVTKRKKKSPSK
jgi:hypothetical protein